MDVDKSVNDVLINVMNKVSKRNIEALGKVEFSTRINFSADGGLRIEEVESIESIKSGSPRELETLLSKMRTTKQKQLLASHFFDLKQTYTIEGNTTFNKNINP
jgi:hypothetical protein